MTLKWSCVHYAAEGHKKKRLYFSNFFFVFDRFRMLPWRFFEFPAKEIARGYATGSTLVTSR